MKADAFFEYSGTTYSDEDEEKPGRDSTCSLERLPGSTRYGHTARPIEYMYFFLKLKCDDSEGLAVSYHRPYAESNQNL